MSLLFHLNNQLIKIERAFKSSVDPITVMNDPSFAIIYFSSISMQGLEKARIVICNVVPSIQNIDETKLFLTQKTSELSFFWTSQLNLILVYIWVLWRTETQNLKSRNQGKKSNIS